MALLPKLLACGDQNLSGGLTTVYTCPADTTAICRWFAVNYGVSSEAFSIAVKRPGIAAVIFIYQDSGTGATPFQFDVPVVLHEGDAIQISATSGGVNVKYVISGVEQYPSSTAGLTTTAGA